MPESRLLAPKDPFPPADLPTIFADGVVNLARTGPVIRFYLMRTDPSMVGSAEYQIQSVAQVIMPIQAFIQSALFVEQELNKVVAADPAIKLMLDELRKQIQQPGETQ